MNGKTVGGCVTSDSYVPASQAPCFGTDYVPPCTLRVRVEVENGFCSGSVVPDEPSEEETITIEHQEIGAESNYFDNTENPDGNRWDY